MTISIALYTCLWAVPHESGRPSHWWLLGPVLCVLICWGIYANRLRGLRSVLDKGAVRIAALPTPHLDGYFQGRAVKIVSDSKGRFKAADEIKICLATSLPYSFHVYKKSVSDQILRRPVIQIGDSEGLRGLSFYPGDDSLVRKWVFRDEVQEKFMALFRGHGVNEMELKDGLLTSTCLFVLKKKYSPKNVRGILEDMNFLLRNLEGSPW